MLFLFISVFLTILQISHPYILLTASVDDVEVLAKQLSRSPVVDELHRIWRRASQQFRQKLNRPAGYRDRDDSDGYDGRRSNFDDNLVALGKNASVYIKAFRRMLNKFR